MQSANPQNSTPTDVKSEDVEVWLDILCLSSLFTIFKINHRQNVKCIYYYLSTDTMNHLVPWVSMVIGKPFIQFTHMDYGRTFSGETSVAEKIEQTNRNMVDELISEWRTNLDVLDFLGGNQFDEELVVRHLGRLAWRYLLRPIELSTVSSLYNTAPSILLLRQNPFRKFIEQKFSDRTFEFFNPPKFRWSYTPRPYHSLDADMTMMRAYCGGPVRQLARTVRYGFEACLSGLRSVPPLAESIKKNRIAVLRSIPFPFSFDELNDMYWWPGSRIEADSITIITDVSPLTQEDRNLARRYGFRLLHLAKPFWRASWLKPDPNDDIVPGPGMGLDIQELACMAKACSLVWGTESTFRSWILFNLKIFELHVHNRARLFTRLGISIIWHMDDMLGEGPFNHQAIRICGGVSAGSHFSNHIYNVPEVEHLEDIAFPWGDLYQRQFFNRHKHMDIVTAGFYQDYKLAPDPGTAPAAYSGKFIISFLDQGMYTDCYLSPATHLEIWQTLIEMLNEMPSIIIVWKPKRNSMVRKIMDQLPEIEQLVADRRIHIIKGKSDTIKTAPSTAANISDLAITAMFSTAGIECWLSGTPTLFIDLSRLTRHFLPVEFHNRVVFDSLEALKRVVRNHVDRDIDACVKLSGKFADDLDPHRDGRAFQRTGCYLKILQQELETAPAEVAVKATRARYRNVC